MASKGILAKRQAQAQTDIAASMKEMAARQEAFIAWQAEFMIVFDERLQAIEAAVGVEYAPPLENEDGDEGEETPPTPEPEKPKRGRPRKVKANG